MILTSTAGMLNLRTVKLEQFDLKINVDFNRQLNGNLRSVNRIPSAHVLGVSVRFYSHQELAAFSNTIALMEMTPMKVEFAHLTYPVMVLLSTPKIRSTKHYWETTLTFEEATDD